MTRSWGRRCICLVGVLVGAGLILVAVLSGSPGHRAVAPATFESPPAATGSVSESASATPTPSTTAATPTSPPVHLSLPTLNVQAAVQRVVTIGGVLGVPEEPAQVGWWAGSARPGAPVGSVVLDGHVDSAVRGTGALSYLTKLQSGDAITLTTAVGVRWSYRVYAREVYSKHRPLPAGLFAAAGPPRLVLITCGGAFNPSTRSYESNIVVFAAPPPL